MRAVESRRYVIRSTNNGITAVIDPAGRIVKQLPSYREIAAAVRFGTVQETTFYAHYGDWFAWGCLAAALMTCAIRPSRFRRKHTEIIEKQ
jgi:apolipoprotein N-acyltransferase